MDFSFYSAGEIIFGSGRIQDLESLIRRFGSRALIVTRGKSLDQSGTLKNISTQLENAGITFEIINFKSGEPVVSDIDKGADAAGRQKPDVVIGIGGGSALDTGKAISGMATNPGSVMDYLEGVGKGLTLKEKSIPYIAVPTTAGTGTEVTKNAVISSVEGRYKKSIRSPLLIPDIALLDPDLTLSLPSQVTAETGMDALTQLVEAYVSRKAQPIPQALSIYGIGLVGKFLKQSVFSGSDVKAREGMLLASLLSGLALANSGLGGVHGIAAALGAVCQVSHGRACAMLLPWVMKENLSSCQKGYAEIGSALFGITDNDEKLAADMTVDKVKELVHSIGIPEKFGPGEIDENDIPELVKGSQGSSMKGNPVDLSDATIEKILRQLI